MGVEIVAHEGANGDNLEPLSPDMLERAGDQSPADPAPLQRFGDDSVRESDLAALAPVGSNGDVSTYVQLEAQLAFIVLNFTHETLS